MTLSLSSAKDSWPFEDKSLTMPKENIAVIGAGVAGLTAAAILAPYAQVTVFERSEHIGGKVRQAPVGHQSIDCGPTVFTMLPIFERVFRLCGEKLEDHLSLTPLSVLARHTWPDKSCLDLFADLDQSEDAIAAFAGPREARAYRQFIKVAEQNWTTLYRPMIEQPRADFHRLLTSTPPQKLLRLNPYIDLWRELCRRFKDERLRQVFGRYTTYCGSSPFQAPAVMSMIAHIEQRGVWSIKGGMQSLSKALWKLAEKRGAFIQRSVEIERVDTAQGRLKGIVGQNYHPCSAVIFNGDASALERGHLGTDATRATHRHEKHNRSLSAMTFSFIGRPQGFSLTTHNVFFDTNYRSEFEAIFHDKCIPIRSTVYLFAPDSQSDTSQPQRFFCLINAPANGDQKVYTDMEQRQCKEKILEHLKRCGLTMMIEENTITTTTPTDFAKRFPATGGALYGQPIHGWKASFQRPGVRTRTKGLYCAGGSVHPGSGVPMAALSGMMAAQSVIKDLALI